MVGPLFTSAPTCKVCLQATFLLSYVYALQIVTASPKPLACGRFTLHGLPRTFSRDFADVKMMYFIIRKLHAEEDNMASALAALYTIFGCKSHQMI